MPPARARSWSSTPPQGVEAQTLANVYQALDANHEIVPVLNKIDLPAAEPDRVKEQIEEVIGLDASNAVPISAKTGLGIEDVLEAIVTRLPPPKGDEAAPLKALLVDSWYDAYLGVVVLVRIVDGVLKKGMTIRMMGTNAVYGVDKVGVFRPKMQDVASLGPGEVGFLTGSIKEVADTAVGDTITEDRRQTAGMLPGFKPVQPVVFCGLFPVDAAEFENLRAAMGRLRLNDASFSYEMETSAALGFGFRCGFLGLLHLEIIQERLEREFNLDLISTAPSVVYRLAMRDGTLKELHNPADMPDVMKIETIEEPWIRATILSPDEYLGGILKLCQDRRGVQIDLNYVGKRAMVIYDLPLNEVVFDFYDRLKSISKGYASFDYQLTDYREGDLVKMSILGQRRAGRCPLHAGPPRARGEPRPGHVREAEGPHPPPPVPDSGPGRDRRQDHRPRDDPGAVQGRHRQVLRRRRDPQAKAPRQAARGQEAHAAVRPGGDPPGGLYRGAEDGQLKRGRPDLAGRSPSRLRRGGLFVFANLFAGGDRIGELLGELGQEFVGVLLFDEGLLQELGRVLHVELLCPGQQRPVARDLVMLHGLGGRDQAGIDGLAPGELLDHLVAFGDDALDRLALDAFWLLAQDLEDLLQPLHLLARLLQVDAEGGPQLLRLRRLGELGQRLNDRVLGEIRVFELVQEQRVQILVGHDLSPCGSRANRFLPTSFRPREHCSITIGTR